MFGILFTILDLLNPRVNTKGKMLDGAVDMATRNKGLGGNIIGHFMRQAINKKYHK